MGSILASNVLQVELVVASGGPYFGSIISSAYHDSNFAQGGTIGNGAATIPSDSSGAYTRSNGGAVDSDFLDHWWYYW